MQAGKSAMDSAKETVANIAASAKSGMEKTKAVIEEKVDRISTNDPVEKDMATLRKEDKIRQAELLKQQAYTQNAAAAAGGIEPYTATGSVGSISMSQSRIESHTTTGTESYKPSAHYEDPASIVPGRGTTTHSSDHVTEAPHNAGTPVGNTAGTGGVPVHDTRTTGPEP